MIVILSGPVHGGKTTLLQNVIPEWKKRGCRIRGFLSPSVYKNGTQEGYDFLDLERGNRAPFLRRTGEVASERVGPYFFVPATLDFAGSLIRSAIPGDVFVVDEVGPLELTKGGLWPAIAETLLRPFLRILLVMREGIVEDFLSLVNAPETDVIGIKDPDVLPKLERILFAPEDCRADQG